MFADPLTARLAAFVREGRLYFGVPLLQFYAMSYEPRQAAAKGVAPFPHMLRWVR